MITAKNKQEYYEALLNKKTEYEGIFYVGVKTTGVFCHSTCPARKPKFENCEFFETAAQALLASFRPCKRCRPLSHPHHVTLKNVGKIKIFNSYPWMRQPHAVNLKSDLV